MIAITTKSSISVKPLDLCIVLLLMFLFRRRLAETRTQCAKPSPSLRNGQFFPCSALHNLFTESIHSFCIAPLIAALATTAHQVTGHQDGKVLRANHGVQPGQGGRPRSKQSTFADAVQSTSSVITIASSSTPSSRLAISSVCAPAVSVQFITS